jgi:hypothetical protein
LGSDEGSRTSNEEAEGIKNLQCFVEFFVEQKNASFARFASHSLAPTSLPAGAMHNMDMESVFRGILADVQREMKEGEYLPVPCEDDERPPLGFKAGAMAIIEISPDVLASEPGARVVSLEGSEDPPVHSDLLRPGAGWEMLLQQLDEKVPRDYLCALLCNARCAAGAALSEKDVRRVLDEWSAEKRGLTNATATFHRGGGSRTTHMGDPHMSEHINSTRVIPDRFFVAVYPAHVPESDRFRDFGKVANQKMRDAVMANAPPAAQFMLRMVGADKA